MSCTKLGLPPGNIMDIPEGTCACGAVVVICGAGTAYWPRKIV